MTAVEWYARATGMTPEMLSKLVSNPELMVLMQNSKLQEVMKKVRHFSINLTAGLIQCCIYQAGTAVDHWRYFFSSSNISFATL